METDHNKINQVLETLPNGFARHQVVLDDHNNPADYIFLEVNAAFEEMTGLKREKILGRKATEVLPGIEKSDFDWIGVYGKVAIEGKSLNFEQYSEPLQRWYEVQAYSDEPGFFTTLFNEITARKEELASMKGLLELTEKLFSTDLATFDYQSVVDNLLKLSGAKFAAINTYEENRTKTVTRAISGTPSIIEQASKLLGFKITGQAWDIIPERTRKIEGGKLVRFSSLYETAMGSLNKTTSTMLHKLTGIGNIYVLELSYGGRETMGDIIFFMPKGKGIQNREAIELYAGQLGSLLSRLRAERELIASEAKYRQLIDNLQEGIWAIDADGYTSYVNDIMAAFLGYEASEMIGKHLFEFVDEEEMKKTERYMARRESGIQEQHESQLLHRNGHKITVLMETGPILDAEGNYKGALAGVVDITERKKIEEQLSIQNAMLKAQQQVSLDGILVVNNDDKIISFNQKFCDMWWIPDNIMALQSGEKALNYVIPKLIDPDGFVRRINELYANKQEKSHEEINLKDGRVLERYSVPMFGEEKQYYGRIWYYRDITERKLVEEALEESENRFNLAISGTGAGLWDWDMVNDKVFFSPYWKTMLGYTDDEIENAFSGWQKLWHPEDAEKIKKAVQDHLDGKTEKYEIEHRVRHKDGNYRHVLTRGDLIKDEKGQPVRWVGTNIDLTHIKQMEEELRESEQKYRSLTDNLPGVAYRCLYDKDWTMQYMSAAIDSITGYPSGEFINNNFRSYESVIHSEDSKMVAREIRSAIDAQKPWDLEYRVMHENGAVRWVRENGQAVINEEGSVDYLDGLILDITDRKEAEEELAGQKNLVEKIIDSLPDSVVYIFDLAEMRNVYASKSLNEILGYTVEEFQAMGDQVLKLLIHPDDFEPFLDHLQSLEKLDEKGIQTIEYRIKHADGSWVWLENRDAVFAWNQAGQPLQTIGAASNITERKQAEAALGLAEQNQRILLDNIQTQVWYLTDDQTYGAVNRAHAAFNGVEIEDLAFKNMHEIFPPEVVDVCREANTKVFETGKPEYTEEWVPHVSGEQRLISVAKMPKLRSDGSVEYVVCSAEDITERKKAEEALRKSEMRNKALIEAVPDMLFRYSKDGAYLDAIVNDEMQLHGDARELYRNNALIGKNITDVFPTPVDEKLTDGISKTLADDSLVIQEYSYMVEGEEKYFEARLAPSGNNEVVSIVRDVTERIRYDKELKYISLHDQLTGLYNRYYFENEIKRLDCSREHPIAVISADLDGLKLINDTLGHSEGDRYLQAGADLLKNTLRESDVLARVGGDEFALLLPRTGKVEAELLINRIRRQIESYNREQKNLPLSISLGLAVSESPEYSLEEVFRMADNNMYTNKLEQGKKARAGIVSSLLASLFKRDNLAEGERAQVQELSIRLGLALQLEESRLTDLELLAQVYDLGKVGLPDNLLHQSMLENTGELTEAEREAIHRHPETGYRIALASPDLAGVAELILRHHENYDGTGYPLGIKGEEVPVECRVLAIAIAYSAMTNPRPYGRTLTHEEALAELKRCAGSQFDPQLVEIFIDLICA